MRAIGKAKAWMKQLKEDMEKESVSQMKTKPHCCSEPVHNTASGEDNGNTDT